MKIEGLRKGNYVFYHKIHKVIGMFETMDISRPDILTRPLEKGSIIRFQGEYNDINPLKITPELLLKAGFKEWRHGCILELEDYTFTWSAKELGIYCDWTDGGIVIPCKHFHHLQNVVYFICGKEFEL